MGGHGTAAAIGATFASYGWNEALTRIGSACTDLLVAFGVASIEIPLVLKYALHLRVLSATGVAFWFFMVLIMPGGTVASWHYCFLVQSAGWRGIEIIN
ncbi:hypothetical protein [Gelria sp. Kuro-4]|uniref:hypothetical protein n=1 Tax=Gelria sp. Kuro-4 TaxID=2796927 RepID=UPI001BEE30F8|nr:hypothetical protein [Gelria sp. Kuro-4]BCV26017.1 hypothetical protein kuro4_27900 [Gelria sp. Kuro-4]